MPWKQMDALTVKRRLYPGLAPARLSDAWAVCSGYGIAPKTGYKWLNRFQAQGMSGLMDHPPMRQRQAHRTAPPVVKQILHYKYTCPFWGPRTIHLALQHHPPGGPVPEVSTIGEMLKQHGLVRPAGRTRITRALPGISAFAEGLPRGSGQTVTGLQPGVNPRGGFSAFGNRPDNE